MVVSNERAALAERAGGVVDDPRVRERLFAPGERLGWEWRDVEESYTPYARRPPVERIYLHDKDELKASPWEVYKRVCVDYSIVGSSGGLLSPVVASNRRRKAARRHEAASEQWREQWREFIARHDQALTAWHREKDDWETRERRRVDQLAEWEALPPPEPSRRLDVYGGTTTGWRALTTTLGSSMLASGDDLFVLDLSQADIANQLFHASELAGLPTRLDVLPDAAEDFDVFAGLSTVAIKDLLVEALHSNDNAPGKELAIYDKILRGVCDILEQHLTIERVHSALQVLLREGSPGGDILSESEWSRIAELFGEESREVIRPHLFQLDSQLEPLRNLGRSSRSVMGASSTRCAGVSIGSKSGGLLNEVLVNVLIQRTIYGFREGAVTAGVLFVVGAELLKRQHLEKLDDIATARGARVVYLFRKLRGDALEAVGAGAAIAAVMRIGNPQEATHAADFIGRQHEFVLAQTNYSRNTTRSTSGGEVKTITGMPGTSINRGFAEQTGDSSGEVMQRTHEYLVEPDVLKGLPETALMLVESAAGGKHRMVREVDCDPALAGNPRASSTPFSDESEQAARATALGEAIDKQQYARYMPDPSAKIVSVGNREALEATVLEHIDMGFVVLSYGPQSVSLYRPFKERRWRDVKRAVFEGSDELVEVVTWVPG